MRKFPELVAQESNLEGVDISLKTTEFWKTKWEGKTFIAVGMQDPTLWSGVIKYIQSMIKNYPDPLEIPEDAHFVQEAGGELVAQKALEYFGIVKK